jgi:hypothetical protein
LPDIGAALEQGGRQPGGHLRRDRLLGHGASTHDGRRAATEQERDLVLLLSDPGLELVDEGLDPIELRLGLAHVQLGCDAAFEAVAGKREVLAPRLEGPPGDLEPQVEVAQLDVGLRHAGHHGERDRPPRLLGGEEVRKLGLVGAADAPEEVELPGEADVDVVIRVRSRLRGGRLR